jgi:propionyl-CoA carboxylase alpha chain
VRVASLPSGYRNSVFPPERTTWHFDDVEVTVEWSARRDGAFEVTASGRTSVVRLRHCARSGNAALGPVDLAGGGDGSPGKGSVDLELDGRRLLADWQHDGQRWWVQGSGAEVALIKVDRFPQSEAEAVVGALAAPMPGLILSVTVAPGNAVVEGQLLVILEAMKMEHRITAPAPGVVSAVHVAPGSQVTSGHVLVDVDEETA